MIASILLEVLVAFGVLAFLGMIFNERIVLKISFGGIVLTLLLQAADHVMQVVGLGTITP